MIANRHISKIVIAVMAAAVVMCFLATAFSSNLTEWLGGAGVTMEYESKLFDTDTVMTVDIQMDGDDWNSMLKNATAEEYYTCDVVVNGTKFTSVAIRLKGNTSLSAIAMDPDSDRFSLKLEFGHFVKGQTCFGLDKLILNNNYADATNMKEAVIYDMYRYLGADASLYNYAEVSVNGEYFGVYLALEAVEQSFMLRNFGTQDGELYKPDSLEMGAGRGAQKSSGSSSGSSGFGGMTPPSGPGGSGFDFGGGSFPSGGRSGSGRSGSGGSGSVPTDSGDSSFPFGSGDFPFDIGDLPDGFDIGDLPDGFDIGDLPDGFDINDLPDGFDAGSLPGQGGSGGGFSMSGGGSNLNYTGDDLDNYSTIWNGEVTNTGTADHRRVVEALKNVSEGNDLEKYLDVDNVLKYMAVHTFAVNMDSLSGSMAHNYYLYEYEGQLNIFPWDYNLSFGGMSMGGSSGASDVVNDAIDTPFSGTKFFDALLENEEYLERYHEYLRELVDGYVNGGVFDETYSRIRDQIDTLVATDPSAFYTADEYEVAAQMLYDTVKLRAQSISGQLDGTIPSTDAGQRADSSSLVDASGIDIGAMGQFNMGGSFSGGFTGGSDKSGSDKGPDSFPSDGNGKDPEDSRDSGGDPGDADRPADPGVSGENGGPGGSQGSGGGDNADGLSGFDIGDIIDGLFDGGFGEDWFGSLPYGGQYEGGSGRMSSDLSEGVIRFTDTGSSGQDPGGLQGGSGRSPGMRPGGSSGFDPGSMPEGGFDFDPGSMPEGGSGFDLGNMPEGGSGFDPGSFPGGGSGFNGGSNPNESESPEEGTPSDGNPQGGRKDAADPGASSGSRSARPGSSGSMAQFSTGFPGVSFGSAALKNLMIYAACMVLIIIALFVIKSVRRTRYRK